MLLSVIVAVAENGVVGVDNALPWRLPEDLRYFKKVTMGKPIVMGRKTHESIGRALPGRPNIVISRNQDFTAPGISVVESIDGALELADEIAREDGQNELMVIGGAGIYALAIPKADRLYLTQVHAEYSGDVFLPAVDWELWLEVSREDHPSASSGSPAFSFLVYERC
ncbi:MAG: dihydrofolate reductase [Halioglobus sp.]|jgi:dihydrofolate reductase